MAGRVSVFSNSKVLAAAQAFVPAADEVWRLQRGGDAECQFFQRAVNHGQLITDNGTRQGIYVMSPSGKVLSRVNSLKAERVLTMMEEGLSAWEALPEDERHLPKDLDIQGEERWEDSRPTQGLLLERIVRDLPADGTPKGERATKWNRDTVWFSQEEVASIVAAAAAARTSDGGWGDVPEALAHRLASYCLVDNVYGQCIPFDRGDLLRVELQIRETIQDGGVRGYEWRGSTLATEDGQWTLGENLWTPKKLHPHAMETSIRGRAHYDTRAEVFLGLELVALGRRSGFTELNSRRFRPEPGGIGFLFRLDQRQWAPAPTFLSLYDAAWVKKPQSGRELRRD